MFLLNLTLDTPAENLALDEALLDWAEQASDDQANNREVLRIWEPSSRFVVVGRSSRLELEVEQETCHRFDVPILRRCSGGAAIVAGPGCLMYAVVLSCNRRPELRAIDRAHEFVLGEIAALLRCHVPSVQQAGTSDLVMSTEDSSSAASPHPVRRKFSGNSMRMKRDHLLYHGTLLYDFDLPQVGKFLSMPPRQPDYRNARPHSQFLANLPISADELRNALISGWCADLPLENWPQQQTARLANSRYRSTSA